MQTIAHAASESWSFEETREYLEKLIAPGVAGVYTHYETTEIVAFPDDGRGAVNVFTAVVAEFRTGLASPSGGFINPKPLRFKSLKGWSFGVMRYTRPIEDLLPAIEDLGAKSEWRQSGQPLMVGKLVPMPPVFVPPDALGPVPVNRALKNNFWNGSHLLEWTDPGKEIFQPFFDHPPRLQDLSEAIREWVPLGIAALSDRLGNIAVQIPVNAVMTSFGLRQNGRDFVLQLAWHPNVRPRPLQVVLALEFDGVITGYTSTPIDGAETTLRLPVQRGPHRGVVWDEENQIVLAATSPSSFISAVGLNIAAMTTEPRVFFVREADGSLVQRRVGLVNLMKSLVGKPHTDDNGGWTQRRMYHEEISRLVRERRFIQYKPLPGKAREKHEEALADVRALIATYGAEGVWLWDPFLSAHDILETLFHCAYMGAELRALSAAREPPEVKGTRDSYSERQRAVFTEADGNRLGLRLEYRARIGPKGWDFHDRFLIFPKTDGGALAWSLGASINSLGRLHHILQRVDDGQLVMDAFQELWDELSGTEHLIWKCP
jgi:hypothetical protein